MLGAPLLPLGTGQLDTQRAGRGPHPTQQPAASLPARPARPALHLSSFLCTLRSHVPVQIPLGLEAAPAPQSAGTLTFPSLPAPFPQSWTQLPDPPLTYVR